MFCLKYITFIYKNLLQKKLLRPKASIMTFFNLRSAFSAFILVSIIPFFTYAQSVATDGSANPLRAIYSFDYKLDSAVTTPKSERMILRISNGMSCFQSKVKYMQDSIGASLSYLPVQEKLNKEGPLWSKLGKTSIYYSIFKEPAKDLVFYHDGIGSEDHQYQERAPLFHWKIMPEKKTIAGYECQQAFTVFGGRMFEAWFTRDIPVSEGPYKFHGLPGLIVKIRDTHDNYVFELLSFENNPKSFAISINSSAPLLKKSKFLQAKYNDDLTFLDRMASVGNQIPESMRNTYLAKLKRRNNPLELK